MVITNNGKVLINNEEIMALPETPPQLYKPSVSIENDSIHIQNNERNGKFRIKYYIKIGDSDIELFNNNDSVYTNEEYAQIIISRYFTEPKAYNLMAKVKSNKFIDSNYTETFSFERYEDDTASTVKISSNFVDDDIPIKMYVKINNDYNTPLREYTMGGATLSFVDIHKMSFYFEHPRLISVNTATLTYTDNNGNEIVDVVGTFVDNGKTNTITFNQLSYATSFQYSFEFVLSASNS